MTKEELIEKLKDIIDQFEDVGYSTEDDWDKVCDIEDELKKLLCEVTGGHHFEYDMCGCWAHRYCVKCRCGQYPELSGKDLTTIRAELGGMTEEEYINKQKA